MPMYDYKCPKCGEEVKELIVSFDERNNQKCPKCGETLARDITSCKPTLIGVG